MAILTQVTQLVNGVDTVSAEDIMDTQETAIDAHNKSVTAETVSQEALEKANEAIESVVQAQGTIVNVGGSPQAMIEFDSDPQTQLDNAVTKDTQQTITGSKIFNNNIESDNRNAWWLPYLLSFKNADSSQTPTYPYTGFYQWGNEWQVNARNSSNAWVHNLLSINTETKKATFGGAISCTAIYLE